MCSHEYCKSHALAQVCSNFGVPVSDTLVIGDSENDICIIKKAGIGISFCSANPLLDSIADYVIKEPDFSLLAPVAG